MVTTTETEDRKLILCSSLIFTSQETHIIHLSSVPYQQQRQQQYSIPSKKKNNPQISEQENNHNCDLLIKFFSSTLLLSFDKIHPSQNTSIFLDKLHHPKSNDLLQMQI